MGPNSSELQQGSKVKILCVPGKLSLLLIIVLKATITFNVMEMRTDMLLFYNIDVVIVLAD